MREAARLQPASRRSRRRVAITATTIAIAAAAVTTRRSRHRITATTIIIAAAAITATTRRCHHRVTIVITTSSRSCIVTPSPVNRDDYGHCRRCAGRLHGHEWPPVRRRVRSWRWRVGCHHLSPRRFGRHHRCDQRTLEHDSRSGLKPPFKQHGDGSQRVCRPGSHCPLSARDRRIKSTIFELIKFPHCCRSRWRRWGCSRAGPCHLTVLAETHVEKAPSARHTL